MANKYAYGTTAWGRYFISTMEAIADSGRLDRGRSYAASGAVLELRINAGQVYAKVAGNFMPFYNVNIVFPLLPKIAINIIEGAFKKDATLYKRVLGGEIPEELLKLSEELGFSIMPQVLSEIKKSCDCPDNKKQCKHLASVYYILAKEIDKDPFLLLKLRGLDQATLAGILDVHKEPGIKSANSSFVIKTCKPWHEPEVSVNFIIEKAALAGYHSVIPAMLPPSKGLAPFDLNNCMLLFYHRAAKASLPYDFKKQNVMDELCAKMFSYAKFDWQFFGYNKIVIDSELFNKDYYGLGKYKNEGILKIAELFLSCEETGGSTSYRFLRAVFNTAVSICRAAAFVPTVLIEKRLIKKKLEKRILVLWKAATFLKDVNKLVTELEDLALPSDSYGLVPDKRSSVELLLSAYITAFVKPIAIILGNKEEDKHPALRALFDTAWIDVSAPALWSLPEALAAWLAVYELIGGAEALSLRFKPIKSNTLDDKTPVYRLSASIRLDGKAISFRQAVLMGGESAKWVLSFTALLSHFVPELLKLSKVPGIKLSEESLCTFVIEAEPTLARFGVKLILPKNLRKLLRLKQAQKAKIKNFQTFLDLNTAFSFDWTTAIDEEKLTIEEFFKLLELDLRLVHYRNRWASIDPLEAAKIMELLRNPEAIDFRKAGEPGLTEDIALDYSHPVIPASIYSKENMSFLVPTSLKAKLRPYQERGFQWLMYYISNSMGCILADDMGLGKTVQTLAVILSLKDSASLKSGALVCAPASLITNWQREAEKFAPSLSLCIYYGKERKLFKADLCLSSYETVQRDIKKISKKEWDLVILDEAHYIKNPRTARARALKSIPSGVRLALTGTPVENNLSELWSIFDFVLPSYLGGLRYFSSEYRRAIELERSKEEIERLKKITSPFILRRLKTDPEIAPDLPEKIIINEYSELSAKQAVLYEAISSEGLAAIGDADPEERLGLVLGLITALKQAGNHPRNYDKESPGLCESSGKSRLLLALLSAAFDAGERVLVFSQYVEMLEILAGIIINDLGIEPLMLHGSMPKKARDRAVDAFQLGHGPGVFLVSLKAGGVGLNLTAATRVMHYDLWWNPAVENQATDRAYRIGQTEKVFVHRLITRHTIEERIDAMINCKKELAGLTISAGESWLGKLSDSELKDLIALH